METATEAASQTVRLKGFPMPQGEVYLVGVLEGCYKIGRSCDSGRRVLDYVPKLPVSVTILHRITTGDTVWLEGLLHVAFTHRRTMGEWFRLSPEDVVLISSLVSASSVGDLPDGLVDLLRLHGHIREPKQPASASDAAPQPPAVVLLSPESVTLNNPMPCGKKTGKVGRPATLPCGSRHSVRCTVVGDEIELVRRAMKKTGLTQLQLARLSLLAYCSQIDAASPQSSP